MSSSEDEKRTFSASTTSDSDEGPGRDRTSSGSSSGSIKAARPKGKCSPKPLCLYERLCDEGFNHSDIKGLVTTFDILPSAFRDKLLLQTKDLLLPLDASVVALRRDLIAPGVEPEAGPSNAPLEPIPREAPALPSTSTRSPHEAPAPSMPKLQITVSEETGRVLTFTPAQGSGAVGTSHVGEPLPPDPRAPLALKRAGTGHIGEPLLPNPKSTRRDGCQLCGESFKFGLRWHMAEAHLPWFFFLSSACFICRRPFRTTALLSRHRARCHEDEVYDVDNDYLVWIRGMMDILGSVTHAFGFVSPHMLLSLCLQREIRVSEGAHFQHAQLSHYRDLALVMGAPLREPLQVRPPNHPVATLHWEILYGLLSTTSRVAQSGVVRLVDPPRDVPNYFSDAPNWVEMADGHCHLNTILARNRLPLVEAVSNWASGVEGCRMAFVVDNRVFGGDWAGPFPTSVALPGPGGRFLKVHYTFGVHPRLASGPPGTLEKLKELAGSDLCVGIGEFGLDKTSPEGTWASQANVFRKQAKLGCSLKKTLVLHLRGSGSVPLESVLREAAGLLLEVGVPNRHPIYIHCFTGTVDQFHAWWKSFPNSYFGVSSKALERGANLEFARGIDLDKFILESDSPYLGLGETPFTPWCLPHLARALGRLRNVPTRAILMLSRTNAMSLYGING